VNDIGAAQERYLLSVFGSEEALLAHIDDFVLEEKTEISPATLDPYSNDYKMKILTTFRVRPKTIEEKEYEAEQRRLSVLRESGTGTDSDEPEHGFDREGGLDPDVPLYLS
jgi:hypothetical protein